MANDTSTALIRHIRKFRDEPWDPNVLRRTELCLLDSLACYSGGISLAHFRRNAAAINRLFGDGSNSPKSEQHLSPFVAAYLYGQAASALDYDDTLLGHPGGPIIGAVLAVGAREDICTDRLLRGVAAGYEVEMILGAAAAPSRERASEVRSVGVWDTVAAALAIGVALGHDDANLERTIGVAAAHSLLPYTAKWFERPVPGMKNNMGWAAAGAVLSTELVIEGQTGITNVLDGDAGMWRMAGSDRWNLDWNLFQKPGVLRAGFKHYPACWHLQEYLKKLSELLAAVKADDEIAKITLTGPQEMEKFCERSILASADIAFSLPVLFSLLISGVEAGPQWYSYDQQDPTMRFRDMFHFERSDERSIRLQTRLGSELKVAVGASDLRDLAAWGLDEEGVLTKHKRLTESRIRDGAFDALSKRDAVPDHLYRALNTSMLRPHRELESA
jgi:2-methylcitrate dehydratase PrpD